MKVMFLEGIFKDKIWGGNKIKEYFGYSIESDCIGEYWGISSHQSGDCKVLNGDFKGMTLSNVWKNNKDLFGNLNYDKFPIMTKVIDSNDDLSIQVHPDDRYANLHENGELGKSECWYVINADEDAKIILGHNISDKSQLVDIVSENRLSEHMNYINIKSGDFFNVPTGTIHALCKGALILEVQQSSDTTYRLYDYDRLDNCGNKRDLHIEKSLDVINIPDVPSKNQFNVHEEDSYKCTTFLRSEFFSVYNLDIKNDSSFVHDNPFSLYNVIDGNGQLVIEGKEYNLNRGDNFILLNNTQAFTIKGRLNLIVSHL